MATTTLWVLGAPSDEMTAIEQLLNRCDQNYVYAMREGQRVTRSDAYAMESLRVAQMKDLDCVFCIECAASHDHYSAGVHVLDHHRPNSRGFDLPPARALEASSLGQVMSWISLLYGDRGEVPPLGWTELNSVLVPSVKPWTSGVISTSISGGELCCRGRWFEVPAELRYVAAVDHCQEAAYRGEVPGVDPDELFLWQIGSRTSSDDRQMPLPRIASVC